MEEASTSTVQKPEMVARSSPQQRAGRIYLVRLWRQAQSISPFASNVALTVAVNLVVAISGFVTGPICARLLGPTGRGQLAAIQNLYWFVATVGLLGTADAALYFTAQKKEDSGMVLASTVALGLLASPLFFLAAFVAAPLLLFAQGADLVRTARWFLVGIPLFPLCTIPLFVLRGISEMGWWNLLRIGQTIGWFFLLAGLWLWTDATPGMVAAGYLAVLGMMLIPTFFVLHKKLSQLRIRPAYWGSMLRYGVPIALSSIPLALNLRLDQIVMAAFLPARSLGIYVVGVSWSWMVPLMLHGIGTVLFPRLAGAEETERGKILTQGTRISFFVALLMVIGVEAMTPIGIPLLFGKAFAESVKVGMILVFAAGVQGMNMVFGEALRGIGKTKTVLFGEVTGLAVTLASLAWLLPRYGIIGAGLASILGYSATGLVALLGTCRAINHSISDVLLLKREDFRLAASKLLAMRAVTSV